MMIKKIFLFIIPFLMTLTIVVGYFKLTQKISTISIPNISSVTFSDLVKLSRFSLEKAPSQSLVGTITSMTGDVEYEARLATESAKITSPTPVQQGESLSTGANGNVILNFKDAAEININSNSDIDVIQTLPLDLVFRQSLGSIEYKKLGNYPVSIRVGHLIIENGGDVKISFTADSPVTTVVMINGTGVVAYNNLKNISKVITITAGQTLKFNESNRKVTMENK